MRYRATRWSDSENELLIVHPGPSGESLKALFLDDVAEPGRLSVTGISGKLAPVVAATVRASEDDVPVLVVRNANAILSRKLLTRYARTLSDLNTRFDRRWLLATPDGLRSDGERLLSSYFSHLCVLPRPRDVSIVCDTFADLYALNPVATRDVLETLPSDLTDGFEVGLILAGSMAQRPSLHVPDLALPVHGEPANRDGVVLGRDLRAVATACGVSGQIETFIGPVALHDDDGDGSLRTGFAMRDFMQVQLDFERTFATEISITIVTRTRFTRPALLRRLLASIARAKTSGVTVDVCLATDLEESVARSRVDALLDGFSGIDVQLASAHGREGASRVRNLIAGVEAASSDYVWIIDDDDYIVPDAFREIQQRVLCAQKPFLFVSSQLVEERWQHEGTRSVLLESKPDAYYEAQNWKRLFAGCNQIPICGFLCPTDHLQNTVRKIRLADNLSEDYALLLAVLATRGLPEIRSIDKPLACISVRADDDNTVTMLDRRPWTSDIQGFLKDLMSNDAVASRGFWDLVVSANEFDTRYQERQDSAFAETMQRLQKRNRELQRTVRMMERKLEALQQARTVYLRAERRARPEPTPPIPRQADAEPSMSDGRAVDLATTGRKA